MVSAYLATTPKHRGEAFLRHAAELLASEEAVALLFPIRPRAHQEETTLARRQAVALFRQLTPLFIEALARRE